MKKRCATEFAYAHKNADANEASNNEKYPIRLKRTVHVFRLLPDQRRLIVVWRSPATRKERYLATISVGDGRWLNGCRPMAITLCIYAPIRFFAIVGKPRPSECTVTSSSNDVWSTPQLSFNETVTLKHRNEQKSTLTVYDQNCRLPTTTCNKQTTVWSCKKAGEVRRSLVSRFSCKATRYRSVFS